MNRKSLLFGAPVLAMASLIAVPNMANAAEKFSIDAGKNMTVSVQQEVDFDAVLRGGPADTNIAWFTARGPEGSTHWVDRTGTDASAVFNDPGTYIVKVRAISDGKRTNDSVTVKVTEAKADDPAPAEKPAEQPKPAKVEKLDVEVGSVRTATVGEPFQLTADITGATADTKAMWWTLEGPQGTHWENKDGDTGIVVFSGTGRHKIKIKVTDGDQVATDTVYVNAVDAAQSAQPAPKSAPQPEAKPEPAPAPAPAAKSGPSRIESGPGRLVEATTTFGPGLGPVPNELISGNLNRRDPGKAASTAKNFCNKALDRNAPNIILSVPLAWHGQSAKADPNGSLKAMRAVAKGEFDELYAGIAKAFVKCGYDSAVIRLGHEHNMAWTPWYSGHGRGADFAAAWRRAADQIRKHAPGIALDWNIGEAGADPTNPEGGSFDPESYPGSEYVDVIGRDVYCRGQGRKLSNIREGLREHVEFARKMGKPVSFPEVGITLPSKTTKTDKLAGDDETCSVILDEILEFANSSDLAYFVLWGALKDSQGYRYRIEQGDTQSWKVLNKHFG